MTGHWGDRFGQEAPLVLLSIHHTMLLVVDHDKTEGWGHLEGVMNLYLMWEKLTLEWKPCYVPTSVVDYSISLLVPLLPNALASAKVGNCFFLIVQFNEISLSINFGLGPALDWSLKGEKKNLILILENILNTDLFLCCLALLIYGNLSASVYIGFWGHLKAPTYQGNSESYAQISIEERDFEDARKKCIDLNKGNRACSYKKISLCQPLCDCSLLDCCGLKNVLI